MGQQNLGLGLCICWLLIGQAQRSPLGLDEEEDSHQVGGLERACRPQVLGLQDARVGFTDFAQNHTLVSHALVLLHTSIDSAFHLLPHSVFRLSAISCKLSHDAVSAIVVIAAMAVTER